MIRSWYSSRRAPQSRAFYAKTGHPDRWKLFRQDVEHVETPEMRREALAFLRRHL